VERALHRGGGTVVARFRGGEQTNPARELAELYHERWQIETAIGAFKSSLKGDGVVLRSKTPDGAEQECWALLCAYHAVRDAICAAATLTDRDPLRVSFVHALDAVRGPVGDQAGRSSQDRVKVEK
jgi:Transposase DDE domain